MACVCGTASNDLVLRAGATYEIDWPITDAAGQPVNLTDYTARAQARPRPGSTVLLHEWSTANGGIALTLGDLTLTVAQADTTGWPVDTAVYDILLFDADGQPYEVASGRISLRAGVTV